MSQESLPGLAVCFAAVRGSMGWGWKTEAPGARGAVLAVPLVAGCSADDLAGLSELC